MFAGSGSLSEELVQVPGLIGWVEEEGRVLSLLW
jgi:hypothetical protein